MGKGKGTGVVSLIYVYTEAGVVLGTGRIGNFSSSDTDSGGYHSQGHYDSLSVPPPDEEGSSSHRQAEEIATWTSGDSEFGVAGPGGRLGGYNSTESSTDDSTYSGYTDTSLSGRNGYSSQDDSSYAAQSHDESQLASNAALTPGGVVAYYNQSEAYNGTYSSGVSAYQDQGAAGSVSQGSASWGVGGHGDGARR